jgi:putative transposase
LGIDVGLESFYTDSTGKKVENPRFLRKSEKKLKKLQRRFSKCKKGSKNRKKAQVKLAIQHLKVSRQRSELTQAEGAFIQKVLGIVQLIVG